ncbi:hypothetical_protein [Leishmania major strain Friedlin]|nr:hypothetical_protein [Leishmania major strain Friedlin]
MVDRSEGTPDAADLVPFREAVATENSDVNELYGCAVSTPGCAATSWLSCSCGEAAGGLGAARRWLARWCCFGCVSALPAKSTRDGAERGCTGRVALCAAGPAHGGALDVALVFRRGPHRRAGGPGFGFSMCVFANADPAEVPLPAHLDDEPSDAYSTAR